MLSMGINWNMTTAVVWLLIEHLSNNDDDSSKRFLKKVTSYCFKIHPILFYVIQFVKYWASVLDLNSKGLWLSLNMNEQNNRCLVITSATKHEINEVVSCCDYATMAKKDTKKHDVRCKVLFC